MSIRSAGEVIREARIRAGLSQEALSEGICSYVTLCNIEKGTYGVSPLTFELLTTKAGAYNEVYPCFENLNDYKCFWNIMNIRFYLNHNSIQEAVRELDILRDKNFNNNKYYYQEWALHIAKIETIKGNMNHESLRDYLYQILLISKPTIDLYNINNMVLTDNEVQIILLYILHNLALGNEADAMKCHEQLCIYMERAKFADREQTIIDIKLNLIKALYLIYKEEYQEALELLLKYNKIANHYIYEVYAYDFFYLRAVCQYKLNHMDDYNKTIKLVHNCEEAMKTDYRPKAFSFLGQLGLADFVVDNPYSKELTFEAKPDFKDGTFDISGRDVMTLGTIIKYHREQQKLSAKMLCDGLCGVSLLSKIENNLISPDITLACTLLSRLGISDKIFTFHGNKEEAAYYDLKEKIAYNIDKKMQEEAFEEMKELVDKSKKIIIKQFYEYRRALYHQDSIYHRGNYEKYEELLLGFVRMTHKDFDIERIEKFKLSHDEFDIIRVIIPGQAHINNPTVAINYYKQLSHYIKISELDLLQKSRWETYTLVMYLEVLDMYKLYPSIIFEMDFEEHNTLRYSIKITGLAYFYYAVALANMKDMEKATRIARYTVAQFMLTGLKNAAEELQGIFLDQYSIEL